MNWIRKWWYARMRRIDMQILWPECIRQAPTLDKAKAAFACHAFNDPAWMALGHDTVYSVIDSLTREL